ncbi:toxin-antitoxin system HicB family antitoxin [Fulvimarina endophytica]|uniref:Toxin-antitoxin system HicB family antitoxin n=1 Tax=Fulvimarina endophytica TaxID=2293836 RepID=A0A371WYM6_9HYPH|nr:toxin-antitoxin system HicB family antitoxin [Fulvimarina endophytica]
MGLPTSSRNAVDRLAERKHAGDNQFIAIAVAEKILALATADEFERRAAAAEFDAFDRIMSRKTDEPSVEADRLDPDLA